MYAFKYTHLDFGLPFPNPSTDLLIRSFIVDNSCFLFYIVYLILLNDCIIYTLLFYNIMCFSFEKYLLTEYVTMFYAYVCIYVYPYDRHR